MERISRAKETSRSGNALHVYHFQKFLSLAGGGDPKQPLSCDMSLFEIPDIVLRPEAYIVSAAESTPIPGGPGLLSVGNFRIRKENAEILGELA